MASELITGQFLEAVFGPVVLNAVLHTRGTSTYMLYI